MRADPFEATWPSVVAWLEAEPDRTAKEMLESLRGCRPSVGERVKASEFGPAIRRDGVVAADFLTSAN